MLLLVLSPLLTYRFGLIGAACAVDIMLAVGTGLALCYAVRYVDVRWGRMVVPPLAGILVTGLASLYFRDTILSERPWINLGIELALMGAIYVAVLSIMEGKRLLNELRQFYVILRSRGEAEV